MKWKRHDPLLWAAAELYRRLSIAARNHDPLNHGVEQLLSVQRQLEQISRQLQTARNRGLTLAAVRLRQTLREQIGVLNRLTADLTGREAGPPGPPLSLRTVLEDVRQLHQEFEHVNLDPKHRRISVTVDPITLEGVELGRFAIELHAARLDRIDSSVFDCVALDPNPASSSDATTHPHVRDNGLCAGEAAVAIANALRDGRVTDAFCLVKAVLQTYNPQSPYVALEEWGGTRCGGCDGIVGRDDLYFCEDCQGDFCDDCISRCEVCDGSFCPDCLEKDRVSDRLCCSQCRHTCGDCGRIVDADNFVEERGLCPGCETRQEPAQSQTMENEHERDQPIAEEPATAP